MFSRRDRLYRIPCHCDRPDLPSFIKSNLEFAAEQQKLSRIIKKIVQTTTIQHYSVEIGRNKANYYYPTINVNKVHVKLFLRTCHLHANLHKLTFLIKYFP